MALRGTDETLRAEIQEVIRRPVDVLVLPGALRIRAAMSVTETVPIVTIDLESDPGPVDREKPRAAWPERERHLDGPAGARRQAS